MLTICRFPGTGMHTPCPAATWKGADTSVYQHDAREHAVPRNAPPCPHLCRLAGVERQHQRRSALPADDQTSGASALARRPAVRATDPEAWLPGWRTRPQRLGGPAHALVRLSELQVREARSLASRDSREGQH